MVHISLRGITARHLALADPLRLRILRLVMERELCVCEIVMALREPQYKISRHLNVLKKAGLVKDRREATWRHYEIDPATGKALGTLLDDIKRALDKDAIVKRDLRHLAACAVRPEGAAAGALEENP